MYFDKKAHKKTNEVEKITIENEELKKQIIAYEEKIQLLENTKTSKK